MEVLLLLRGSADRAWSVAEIVREMRASSPLVADTLARLQQSALVRGDDEDRFVFVPAHGLADLCDRLADAYRERPVQVINAIAAPPDKLQRLADAFRLRKDKP